MLRVQQQHSGTNCSGYSWHLHLVLLLSPTIQIKTVILVGGAFAKAECRVERLKTTQQEFWFLAMIWGILPLQFTAQDTCLEACCVKFNHVQRENKCVRKGEVYALPERNTHVLPFVTMYMMHTQTLALARDVLGAFDWIVTHLMDLCQRRVVTT